ncbi:50S ribosomal protein L5 [Candidatus Woesearchaeota archaeon]|nr:50S ribosomal protein L5 [Candidatus Woesearchaeota archaeon]
MNKMKQIRIEKVTINLGTGTDQEKLKKAMKLVQNLTGVVPVKTHSKKRIPSWNLRPGLPIGCKTTLRGEKAIGLLKRLLMAKENLLSENSFGEEGNVSFGIPEYIDIPELNYDPEIGIMGLQVCVTLERPGYRVKRRKNSKRKISKSHLITKQESVDFFKENFGVGVEES